MKLNLKQIITFILIGTLINGKSYADGLSTDELRSKYDKTYSEYKLSVENYVSMMRASFAKDFFARNLSMMVAIAEKDFTNLGNKLQSKKSAVLESFDALNANIEKINKVLNKKFDLETYEEFTNDFFKFENQLNTLEFELYQLKAIRSEMSDLKEGMQDIFEKSVKAGSIVYEDFGLVPRPLEWKNVVMALSDPFYEAKMMTGFTFGIVTALVAYVAIYGFAALANAFSLSIGQLTIGGGAAPTAGGSTGAAAAGGASVNGVGAGPAIIVLVVIIIVACWANYEAQKENKKREKEAKEAYSELETKIKAVLAWYEQNKLSDVEYRNIGRGVFDEYTKNGVLGQFQIKLDEYLKIQDEQINIVEKEVKDFYRLRNEIEKSTDIIKAAIITNGQKDFFKNLDERLQVTRVQRKAKEYINATLIPEMVELKNRIFKYSNDAKVKCKDYNWDFYQIAFENIKIDAFRINPDSKNDSEITKRLNQQYDSLLAYFNLAYGGCENEQNETVLPLY